VSDTQFLLVHGYTGSGPEHWQRWLARRLSDRGFDVHFPEFPRPDSPRLHEWRAALERELAHCDAGRLVVLAHSAGSLLWLHHAAGRTTRLASRVLLVAPPGPGWDEPSVQGFVPTPIDPDGIRASALETRLVGTADDPYCSEDELRTYARAADVQLDLLPAGGHLNTDAGFGPWPAVEEWALGAASVSAPQDAREREAGRTGLEGARIGPWMDD
jgi:hypothetical protein